MEVLYPRCAGLDVHKDVVVACVRCVSTPVHQERLQFSHHDERIVETWPNG